MSATYRLRSFLGEGPEVDAANALDYCYALPAPPRSRAPGPQMAWPVVNRACSFTGESSPRSDAMRQLLICTPHPAVDRAASQDVGSSNGEIDWMQKYRVECGAEPPS